MIWSKRIPNIFHGMLADFKMVETISFQVTYYIEYKICICDIWNNLFYFSYEKLVLKRSHPTPLLIYPAMEKQLRLIRRHVSRDARMLMDVATFHSGPRKIHVIFQAIQLHVIGMNGLLLDQKDVKENVRLVAILQYYYSPFYISTHPICSNRYLLTFTYM